MLYYIVCAVTGYLIGSIPFGYIFVKLIKRIDIRSVGSGNIGATNVGRILGWPFGALVFLLDAAKGFFPIVFLPYNYYCLFIDLFGYSSSLILPLCGCVIPPEESFYVMGLSIIIGHLFPLYIGFKGGKGVATSLGVFLLIAPIPTFVAMISWVLFLLLFGYVSLSSIIAAISLAISSILMYYELRRVILWGDPHSLYVVFSCVIVSLLVIIRHIPNIKRLIAGTEPKVRLWKKEPRMDTNKHEGI